MASWNIEKIIFNLKWKALLFLDNVVNHKSTKVKDKIKECETALSVIPSSFMWRLQLLDISITKFLNKVI